MCPPGHASLRDPFTGRHTGRPLRIRLKYQSTPKQRAGTEPRPYRSIAVPSSGPMWASAPTKGKEGCRNHPGQRRTAERLRRGREGWAGIGAKTIPKGGPPPRPPRQRLAKRKARKEQLVKFDFCPTTSECSTAYNVRKPQQSPARAPVGAAITEQNGLGPRPVVQEDAERPGCTTRTRFFF